jgi:starch-binding outer membrane protein, SusD/RagB family
MKYSKNVLKISAFFLLGTVGCSKDYLETTPTNAVGSAQIFSSVSDIQTGFSGAYNSMFGFGIGGYTGHDNYGQRSIDVQNDLMGSDMLPNSAGFGWYNRNYQYTGWQLAVNDRQSDVAWVRYYNLIKQMNNVIEGVDNLDKSKNSQEEMDKLKGQALGIRGSCYYHLINYFQQTYKGNENKPGVPLSTDKVLGGDRSTVKAVYAQIVADLDLAEKLLLNKTFADKTYFEVHVVQGYRARTALVMNDWAIAADYAKKAYTGNGQLMTVDQYRDGFSKISNPEWMYGSYVPSTLATIYASFFSHFDIKTNGYASLGGQKKMPKDLYDQIPVGDVRKTLFQQDVALVPANGLYTQAISGYASPSTLSPQYNQLKFRVPFPPGFGADYVYMRIAEMYLIEAEAKARLGDETYSKLVLQTLIKTRNPNYLATSFSGPALINEILLQRRIELWGEGHSLIDIKRTNRGLTRTKGSGNHGVPGYEAVVYSLPDASPLFLMRIPQRELDANPFLTPADQNP